MRWSWQGAESQQATAAKQTGAHPTISIYLTAPINAGFTMTGLLHNDLEMTLLIVRFYKPANFYNGQILKRKYRKEVAREAPQSWVLLREQQTIFLIKTNLGKYLISISRLLTETASRDTGYKGVSSGTPGQGAGAAGVAQWLRALPVLPEDGGSAIENSNFWACDTLLSPQWVCRHAS